MRYKGSKMKLRTLGIDQNDTSTCHPRGAYGAIDELPTDGLNDSDDEEQNVLIR